MHQIFPTSLSNHRHLALIHTLCSYHIEPIIIGSGISTAFSKFDSYMFAEPNLSNKILNKEKLLLICREIKVVIKFVHRQNKALSDFSDQKVRPGVKPCFFLQLRNESIRLHCGA